MNTPHDPAASAMLAGPTRDALCEAIASLDTIDRQASPAVWCQTLTHVGRCLCSVGATAHAEWYLQQGLRWARTFDGADLAIDLLCELAELAAQQARQEEPGEEGHRRAHAARERARDRCFEASGLASRAADAQREVAVLLRVSDVLEGCGDHDDAIALQCRAIDRMSQDPTAAPQASAPQALM
jgi:hypothetical protein